AVVPARRYSQTISHRRRMGTHPAIRPFAIRGAAARGGSSSSDQPSARRCLTSVARNLGLVLAYEVIVVFPSETRARLVGPHCIMDSNSNPGNVQAPGVIRRCSYQFLLSQACRRTSRMPAEVSPAPTTAPPVGQVPPLPPVPVAPIAPQAPPAPAAPPRTFRFLRASDVPTAPLEWGKAEEQVRKAVGEALNARNVAFLLGAGCSSL